MLHKTVTYISAPVLRGKEWFKITEMKKQKTGYDAVERKY